MLSGLLMFYSLVHVLHFVGFFHRDEILGNDILTIGYIVRNVFFCFYIMIALDALLLHVSAIACFLWSHIPDMFLVEPLNR